MMNCLAIDDEPLALDLLEDNIKKIPYLNLVKRCSNAIEANEFLQTNEVDLIFLDIQMPGISGTEFLQSFHRKPPLVIFITAYEEYAVEGYNLDVVDYLLKPVSFDRFLKAINKATERFRLKDQHPGASQPLHYLFVNADYQIVHIDLNDILYVEGLKDYVKIFLESAARPVITRLSMKGLEEKLPSERFVRVHKSFIVAIDKIKSIRRGRISLSGKDAQIPISSNFKQNLNRFLNPLGLK
jgi:two-component system, LytTR family, response regulator